MPELIDKFSLERVNKSGAVFDIEKLNWLNAQHLRNKPDEELIIMLKNEIQNNPELKNSSYTNEYLLKIINAMKERVTFIYEFLSKSPYFFEAPVEYEISSRIKNWTAKTPEQIKKLRNDFALLNKPVKEDFENALKQAATELNIGAGKLIHPLRLAVSGISTGPGVYDILDILGKEEVIRRIDRALEKIK